MRVLVTGGAGYIGSVVVEELLAHGAERVVVLDNLSTGHAAAVTPPATLVVGDIGDGEVVSKVCRDQRIDAVIHMAALALVGESVARPEIYYHNNVVKALALLEAVRTSGVRRFVFSSTCATYGEPERTPITEDLPNRPTNPYGETKLAFERALFWSDRAHGLRYTALRYFNAAGATERNGEDHQPESHIIPNVFRAARGERDAVQVMGTDYPTPDGTCVRDYIHVSDLARAHVLALTGMEQRGSRIYNLGCGGGYSVRQVIATAEAVIGRRIPAVDAPRRPGDPAVLVAGSARIQTELGWQPRKQDLSVIIGDAWAWLEKHPRRYAE